MQINSCEIIFYVADQNRSRDFYAALLQQEPILDVPGMCEFQLMPNLKLGLMPESGIAKILLPVTKHPNTGNGIPRNELYIIVEDINTVFNNAIANGAILVSAIEKRDWGDTVGYIQDFDGHIIAIAAHT